jgi:hypothetical protein
VLNVITIVILVKVVIKNLFLNHISLTGNSQQHKLLAMLPSQSSMHACGSSKANQELLSHDISKDQSGTRFIWGFRTRKIPKTASNIGNILYPIDCDISKVF